VKKDDENVEENKPTNNTELSATRTSKRIEQTKQETGDNVLKEMTRKTPKKADTDIEVEKPGSSPNMRRNTDSSHTRRNNNGQNRRRNKNRKQNIKEDNENTTKKTNSNIKDATKESQDNPSENISNTKHELNVEEGNQTTMTKKLNENIIEENDSLIESQEKGKEAKGIIEDKVLETIVEINNTEESKENTSINTSKSEETLKSKKL
jgi:hypothetical protein